MKKCLLVLFVAMLVCTVQAQYRTYKNQYDVKEYTHQNTDRYSPTAAGILSIIPGLGHCSVGEPLRGFGFFGLTYGSLVLTVYGVSQAYQSSDKEEVGWLVGSGAIMFVGSYIWSIADVTRVAKIKNMHLRDQKLSLHVYPSIQLMSVQPTRKGNIPGITLHVNF